MEEAARAVAVARRCNTKHKAAGSTYLRDCYQCSQFATKPTDTSKIPGDSLDLSIIADTEAAGCSLDYGRLM